jgi:hypothetical protein
VLEALQMENEILLANAAKDGNLDLVRGLLNQETNVNSIGAVFDISLFFDFDFIISHEIWWYMCIEREHATDLGR